MMSYYLERRNHYLLCLAVVLTLVGCTGAVDNNTPGHTDTLYTAKAVQETNYQNPKRALEIIDTAEMLGNMTHQQADIVRARIYSYDESTKDSARAICLQLLRQGSLSTPQQAEVLDVLVYVARMRGDDEGVLKYGLQYIEACRQLDDETEALLTQSEMGEALIHLGRTDEGLAKIDDAIDRLDKVRNFNEMDVCVRAMKRKIMALIDLNRFDEVIPVAERVLEKMSDYGEHATDYDDSSGRMPTDKCRPGYIDFYTGQAYAFMAYAYSMLVDTIKVDKLIRSHDNLSTYQRINPSTKDMARECLRLFNQTDYSQTIGGKKMISSTWCQLGMYDKMLAFYDELKTLWGSDTMHCDYAVMLKNSAIAARAQRNYQLSDSYLQRYMSITEKLNDAERQATAQDYAARYHEQEQQLALEKEQAAMKRMGSLAVFLGIIVLLAVIFIVILLRQAFSIRKKNAVLQNEIKERIGYEEKYIASTRNIENQDIRTSEHPDIQTSDIASLSDSELFDYIRKFVSENNLHLDPQFGRDQLVERLQLSKERIGAAFSQGSDYGSIANFLNDVRLSHSTKLLTEYPEMPVAEVATASGFTNRVVFSRNFKERFAMTPTEFREKK